MSNFSVEELAKFQDVFYKFDENDDGRISLNEAMHAFRLLGFSPNVGEVQEMFTEKESLHKGSLDFPQFILILEKNLKTPDSTEDIIKAFETLDPKRSGYIRASDIYTIITSLGDPKINSEEVNEMLREADVKKNGVINYREFAKKLGES
ncbi:calmodulin-A isoform X1 [Hydra vulgaris]|uniref:calmodulin-A isoform X1 n=1 Tax=Hydra vulgaris TaxID=6087 RepID=UPI0006411B97|nr:calmodulin-A isoform X1 [Hydra vulgaris]